MNNNDHHDGKFSSGFILGLILGGGLVFLLGTRTGKNLLKIISEQGLDGLLNLLEEYDLDDLIEVEEEDETPKDNTSNGHAKEAPIKKEVYEEVEKKETPKRRFFKRVRRN